MLDPGVERELHLIGIIVQAEACAAEVPQGHKTVLVGYLFQSRQRGLVQNRRQLLHQARFRHDDPSIGLDADENLSQTRLSLDKRDVQHDRAAGGVEARRDGFGIARGFRLGDTRAELDAAACIANLDARRLQGFERHLIVTIGKAHKSVERGRLLLQNRRENVHEGGFGQKNLVVGVRPDLDLPQNVAVNHDDPGRPALPIGGCFEFAGPDGEAAKVDDAAAPPRMIPGGCGRLGRKPPASKSAISR